MLWGHVERCKVEGADRKRQDQLEALSPSVDCGTNPSRHIASLVPQAPDVLDLYHIATGDFW